jgi:Vitamin K-dependent gamma-carboxylase
VSNTTQFGALAPVGKEDGSFFFRNEIPYGMALVRILFPWTLLINIFQRWPYVRELYSADGAPAPLADNFGFMNWLPEFSGGVAVALYAVMTFLLIAGSVGWMTRVSFLISTFLYAYFGLMDCMSTITKYTVIGTHILLLLGVSEAGRIWSVDAWLARRGGLAGNPATEDYRAPIWAARLVQLLIGIIYLGAGITKMHTPAFFSGDQMMYWMMTEVNNEHPLGDYLSQYPLVLSAFAYITIVWEVAFLFAVFQKRMKWLMLAIGAAFHIMTAFTLGLFVFPTVMLTAYLIFLSEAEVTWLISRLVPQSLARRLLMTASDRAMPIEAAAVSWKSRLAPVGVFALALGLVSLMAVEVEYWMDPYQERTAGGPLPLKEISEERVAELFSKDIPLRQSDKLLAFDLGTQLVGEHLFNRRKDFRQGDNMVAQVSLCPPHEDMWIDCVVQEARTIETAGEVEVVPGRIVARTGQFVGRESFRSNFFIYIDQRFEPGDYFVRLRSGNEEVARKRFSVAETVKQAAAN